MKLKMCACPGCGRAVDGRYCSEHQRPVSLYKGTKRRRSDSYNWMYRTSRWTRERRLYLDENPFCVACGATATIVDHITPHRGDEALFWDRTNWQSMCMSCHSAKTLRENNFFHRKG